MDPTQLAAIWQQSAAHGLGETGPELLAESYAGCSDLFTAILSSLRESSSGNSPALISLERSHGYLVLWADSTGVVDGRLGRLASALEKSRRARISTFRLLFSICQTLIKSKRNRKLYVHCAKIPQGLSTRLTKETQMKLSDQIRRVDLVASELDYLIARENSHDGDSESESDSDSVTDFDNLDEIAKDLHTDTQCLLDLGSRFDECAVGPVPREKPIHVDGLDSSPSFVEQLQWHAPQSQQQLASRRGKAKWALALDCLAEEEKDQSHDFQETWPEMAPTTFSDSALGTSAVPPSSGFDWTPYDDPFLTEVTGNDGPVTASSSTLPGDIKTSGAFSEGNAFSTSEDAIKCHECGWKPHSIPLSGVRSVQKMQLAVEKHIKRNHSVKDYFCPVCSQGFRNRPDNVKPHIKRKHPELLDSLYPKTTQSTLPIHDKTLPTHDKTS